MILLNLIAKSQFNLDWNTASKGYSSKVFKFGTSVFYKQGISFKPKIGDRIGVFSHDTLLNKYVCRSKHTIVDTNYYQVSLIAVSDSDLGFSESMKIVFVYYDTQNQCVNYLNDDLDSHNFNYRDTSTVGRFNIEEPQMSYTASVYKKDTTLFPALTNTFIGFKSYYSSPTGLDFDTLSGQINVAKSIVGNYQIKINTENCMSNYISNVSILKRIISIDPDTMTFTLQNPTCDTLGSLKCNNFNVNDSIQFYALNLADSSKIFSTNNSILNIKAGEYKIVFFKEIQTWTVSKNLLFKLECKDNVYYSFNENQPLEIFIEKTGNTKIYNKDGVLIKNLFTPAVWNGTDQNNYPVPMGDYLIITNNDSHKLITIFK
ncbi:MAG: hypothetical protein U0V72_01785 [Cytophagales bacterium]